jgi:hypothetical protein
MLKRFFKWLNFNPLPYGTADEWVDWEQQFKQQAPIRYYIMKLDNPLRVAYHYIKNTYRRVCLFVRYRTYDKYHVINTGLKPDYYGREQRLLHSCFALLVEYVNVEQASKQLWCTEGLRNKRNYRKYKIPFVYDIAFNEPELGVQYLQWEMQLSDEEGGHDGEMTQRALAQEVYDLYMWWTVTRPNRCPVPFPEQLTGIYADMPLMYTCSDRFKNDHPDLYELQRKHWRDSDAQEAEWFTEDAAMLHRLIDIRRRMW